MTSTNIRRPESDAVSVFRWGLRKYAWLVVCSMVALGAVVPAVIAGATPDRYEAAAQVGPTTDIRLQNLDPLPRLAETVFRNGAVAAAVRQAFDPPLPASDPIIPGRVELVAPQDNLVFTVLGRGSSSAVATDVANVAAGTLTDQLNHYDQAVGRFAVQSSATPPARRLARLGLPAAVGAGILGGLLLGVGLVTALVVWRRPVIDAAAAERVVGVPVISMLELTRSHDFRGLPQLCHYLVRNSLEVVFLTGPPSGRAERRKLAEIVPRLLAGPNDVRVLHSEETRAKKRPSEERGRTTETSGVVIVPEPTQAQLVRRPASSLTLLMVPTGISHGALQRYAERYLGAEDVGLVLVRHSSRLADPLPPRAARRRTAKDRSRVA